MIPLIDFNTANCSLASKGTVVLTDAVIDQQCAGPLTTVNPLTVTVAAADYALRSLHHWSPDYTSTVSYG